MQPGKRYTLFTVLFLVVSLVFLLLAEIGVRTRMYFKYGTFWGFEMKVVDQASGLKIPRPNSVNGPIVINSLGFRSPELQQTDPKKVVRFAFLGGSTTFCQEVSGNDMVWPDILTRQLQKAFPNSPIDYINASATAYNASDSLVNLSQRVAPHSPNVVFIYHAVNDIAVNGFKQAREQGVASSNRAQYTWHKKLNEVSLLAELIHKNLGILNRQKKIDLMDNKIELDIDQLAQAFRHDLEMLVNEALNVAELVVIPVFVNHLRADQTPAEKEVASTTHAFHFSYLTSDDLILAFDTYNDVIREFGVHENVLIIETEDAIEGTPENFIDSVHFTNTGSERLAGHLAMELSNSPRFKATMKEMSP